MTENHEVQGLLNFIDASPSPWHAVKTVEKLLKSFQFSKLDETLKWSLEPGGRYYVVRDDSSIILFVQGQKPLVDTGFRIIGAHTDSPGLRVKPNAAHSEGGLVRIGVEVYGGPILATFTDRDFSLAGRVSYRSNKDKIETRLVCFEQPQKHQALQQCGSRILLHLEPEPLRGAFVCDGFDLCDRGVTIRSRVML